MMIELHPQALSAPRSSFPCSFASCEHVFATNAEVVSHMSSAHVSDFLPGEKCPIRHCPKILPNIDSSARRHVERHLKDYEKVWECDHPDCHARFKEKSKLNRHSIVHTNKRPFVCEECSKGFQYQHNLLMHQRVHTGQKPFKCSLPGCDKTFSQASNCKMHMQICGKNKGRKRRPAPSDSETETGGEKRYKEDEERGNRADAYNQDASASTSVQDTSGNSLEELERALFDTPYDVSPVAVRHLHSPIPVPFGYKPF